VQTEVSAAALEFLILTAARSGEVLRAKVSEIDLDRAVWTVPAERMKAGLVHQVPLSKTALSIAKPAVEAGQEYLFEVQGRRLPGKSFCAEPCHNQTDPLPGIVKSANQAASFPLRLQP
jgi:integrase